jgi:hypothetical protein
MNHIKDSWNVSPITDSQTVQANTGTDMLGHDTNGQLYLGNTTLLWCDGLHCVKLQVLCALFSEVFSVKDCVSYIFIMSSVFFNHPDTFCYVCVVNWLTNLRDEILPHSLKNGMSFILGVQWVTKIKFRPRHIFYAACVKMGKWFVPNAVCHFYG